MAFDLGKSMKDLANAAKDAAKDKLEQGIESAKEALDQRINSQQQPARPPVQPPPLADLHAVFCCRSYRGRTYLSSSDSAGAINTARCRHATGIRSTITNPASAAGSPAMA